MGKRSRRRAKDTGTPAAAGGPSSFADLGIDLELDADAVVAAAEEVRLDLADDHGALILRTVMSLGTRSEYAALLKGERSAASAVREDTWQRAVEFLFERLVIGWEVSGVLTHGQRELLARLRAATQAERLAVRDGLRAHLAAHFPELQAP